MDSNLAVAFLGLIAVALVVQTGYLIYLGRAGQKVANRLAALEQQLTEEVRPTLASLQRLTENAELISRRVALGMPQFEAAVQEAVHNIRRATEAIDLLESVLLMPLRPLARGFALFKGLRRGLESYRSAPRLTSGNRS
jgi:hypothetical protein